MLHVRKHSTNDLTGMAMSKEEAMKAEQSIGGYMTNVYLVGLSVAVGVLAAVTAVLLLWVPLAKLAARFFQ